MNNILTVHVTHIKGLEDKHIQVNFKIKSEVLNFVSEGYLLLDENQQQEITDNYDDINEYILDQLCLELKI